MAKTLSFPYPEPPDPGAIIEVAPGVLWARFPLPFRLNHINVFLLADGDGWAVIDAGIADDASRDAWQALMAGPLRGERLTRLIVTHSHPDHIGLAGWLCARFGAALVTSQTAWLTCLYESLAPDALDRATYHLDYLRHGFGDHAETLMQFGHRYLRMVEPLPDTFRRIVAGDVLHIGERDFRVLTGDGHAPEQVMLHCASDGLFLAADQVLANITPNVSVWATDPDGDPLGLYLRSLAMIGREVSDDVLVLPGHQLPFRGLHSRLKALARHHEDRFSRILAACSEAPRSVFELLPALFRLPLGPHETSFAFSEARAHVNRMVIEGTLRWVDLGDGTARISPN
ncbi:MAG: MBL fold metallo-hydrolase [Burkholderiaceae bacterium]|nr:MBL fold metallo-hydrolase [Burkholderiaceae bacterium]